MSDGNTPPEIANGSFVSWSGGKGRVDLIVTNGKVPGVEGDVEGSAKTPAARVVVWENGKPTRKKVGASTHTLKRIAPIKADEKKTGPAALVEILAEHEATIEEIGLPAYAAVSAKSMKAAYDRGLLSHPGPDATTLTAEEWATGRAEHLVKVAATMEDQDVVAGNDTDLLDPEHPRHTESTTIEGQADLFAEPGTPAVPGFNPPADLFTDPDPTAAPSDTPDPAEQGQDAADDRKGDPEGGDPEGADPEGGDQVGDTTKNPDDTDPEGGEKTLTLSAEEVQATLARFNQAAT